MEVQCGVLECGILIIGLDGSFLFEVCAKCGIGACVRLCDQVEGDLQLFH